MSGSGRLVELVGYLKSGWLADEGWLAGIEPSARLSDGLYIYADRSFLLAQYYAEIVHAEEALENLRGLLR
jgi:hypothetical protein